MGKTVEIRKELEMSKSVCPQCGSNRFTMKTEKRVVHVKSETANPFRAITRFLTGSNGGDSQIIETTETVTRKVCDNCGMIVGD